MSALILPRLARTLWRGAWPLLCLWLLPGCATRLSAPPAPPAPAPATVQVYVQQDGWHTSLVLPAALVRAHTRFLDEEPETVSHMGFGWGDRLFFTGQGEGWQGALRAVFASQGPALQALPYGRPPRSGQPAGREVVALSVSPAQARRLVDFVQDTLAPPEGATAQDLMGLQPGNGRFYAAQGRYGLLSNCNVWVGEALASAGLPVRTRPYSLTAEGLMAQARRWALESAPDTGPAGPALAPHDTLAAPLAAAPTPSP
ncbi:DUF2459 domain-containing protein [Ideonella livida]|uniref:DUF2459 domain-containing protein n=1 Tax=Ideonella livida TaxID=2707176 RepID=A0A7C9THV8_9BURK|nr:DUF2459 domain-containing protein [Ideonella livida]NDY89964.1 DUF2459 domain-containing protein [Ideonella livida]